MRIVFKNWEEKLKTTLTILCIVVACTSVSAQETGDAYKNSVLDRPAETELLLNQGEGESPIENADDAVDLPGLGFGDFLRMFLILGFVIALIYGLFWLLKRFSAVKVQGEEILKIISTRPLKGDAALYLVEAGNRLLLIGSAGNSVNLLVEIDDKETIDEIRLQASSVQETKEGFSHLLKKKLNADTISPGKTANPAGFFQRQKERLKKL